MPDPQFQVLVSPSPGYASDPRAPQDEHGRYSRLRIFLVLFAATALAGLAYTFVRPPVYRSTATLIVVPPNPVSLPRVSVAGNGSGSGARQSAGAASSPDGSAAVQSQLIGGQSIISRLYDHLKSVDPATQGLPDSLVDLEGMLNVVPVNGTNMVELRAEGAPASLLPLLVNNWIDVYLKAYAASQQSDANSASTALSDQLASLEKKIGDQRQQLQAFRKQYDIVSIQRDENRVLARLKGLNTSLDKANDEQAQAEAHLTALREAVARGEPMVRPQDQRGLDALEQQTVDLQQQLSNYQQLYTPAYMTLDQNIVALRRRLSLLKEKLRQKRTESSQAALAQAQQAVVSARQVVSQLRQQLSEHKKAAADFSARLAQYQAMDDELQQFQTMQRSAQDRLVQLQVGRSDVLPAVRVLERASTPGAPIRPRYLRDAGISLGAALVLGLLGIWLLEFLTRPRREAAGPQLSPALYTISGASSAALPGAPVRQFPPGGEPPPALAHARPRELAPEEVQAMLGASDAPKQALIGALLSGLRAQEAAALRWTDVDLEHGWLERSNGRRLALPAALVRVWQTAYPEHAGPGAPVWLDGQGDGQTPAGLDAVINAAAVYAGLARPQEVDAEVLRHTYLAFLARQGLEMAELTQIAGTLSETEIGVYSVLAPPGTGRRTEQVNTVYPALEDIAPGT